MSFPFSGQASRNLRRPISFFSSRLNKSQRNYSTSELETWAIVAATRKWRKYLQAASVVEIWTDHNALQWLRRQKDPRGKFTRWLIELETISYNIMYRKGKDNVVADHLSRFPGQFDEDINEESECFERFLYPIDNIGPSDEMALKQSADPVIANAKYQLAAQKLVIDGPLKNQSNLRIVGDRLYRGCQFVVPESMRNRYFLLPIKGVMQEFPGLSVKLVKDTTGLQCGKILETIVDRALRV